MNQINGHKYTKDQVKVDESKMEVDLQCMGCKEDLLIKMSI